RDHRPQHRGSPAARLGSPDPHAVPALDRHGRRSPPGRRPRRTRRSAGLTAVNPRDERFYRRQAERLELPFAELDEVDERAARAIPPELARALRAMPFALTEKAIAVAVAAPEHAAATFAIGAVTGLRVDLALSTPERIARALKAAYGSRERRHPSGGGVRARARRAPRPA